MIVEKQYNDNNSQQQPRGRPRPRGALRDSNQRGRDIRRRGRRRRLRFGD